jgi:hypothetical protein
MQTKMISQSRHTRCELCGEVLTDKESIARGIGPVCANKQKSIYALVAAGADAERCGLGDYQLTTRGSKLRQLQRIAVRYSEAIPSNLRRDLHNAEKHYAQRVAFLAKQGFVTVEVN